MQEIDRSISNCKLIGIGKSTFHDSIFQSMFQHCSQLYTFERFLIWCFTSYRLTLNIYFYYVTSICSLANIFLTIFPRFEFFKLSKLLLFSLSFCLSFIRIEIQLFAIESETFPWTWIQFVERER